MKKKAMEKTTVCVSGNSLRGFERLTDNKRTITLNVLGWRIDLSGCPVRCSLPNFIFSHVEEEDGTDKHKDSHAKNLESETTDHNTNTAPRFGFSGC